MAAKVSEQVTNIDDPETFQFLLPATGKPFTPEEVRGGYVSEDGRRRIRLSPTKMVTFDLCPANFRNQMIGKEEDGGSIYTAVGTAAHAVLEALNKNVRLTPDEREAMFKRELIQICSASMGTKNEIPLSFPTGYKETKETLRNYEIPFGARVFSAESKQVLRFSAFDFSYIADVIYEYLEDGTIEIRDYKTNANTPKTVIQLDYYALMTVTRFPELLGRRIRASYHMLRKDKVVYRDYEPGYFETLRALLDKQVNLMAAMFRLDCFDTRPSSEACQWCALKPSCPDVYDPRNEDTSLIRKAFGL